MSRRSALTPETGRTLLTPEQRSALQLEGYLHLRAVLSPREVEAMRTAWDALLAEGRRLKTGGGEAINDGPQDMERGPAFGPCLDHPKVMSAVAVLLGGDVVFLTLRGRDPAKGHGLQGLHADSPLRPDPERQMLANAFWVLDDMDGANGATRLVPGSHRLHELPRGKWAQPQGRHPQEQVMKARAGDVIVFSAHLWHAGSLNRSGARRRIAIAHFARAEVAKTYRSMEA